MKIYSIHIYGIVAIILITISCSNQNYNRGKKLYETHCESCHQTDGNGLAKLYPTLNNADYWKENKLKIPCIIRYGIEDTIQVNGVSYSTQMNGIPELTEYEISNIINYIDYTWYENGRKLKIEEIKTALKNCK